MEKFSVFTFNRVALVLFLLSVSGLMMRFYDGVLTGESLARFLVFWVMVAIGRSIVLLCRRWAS